MAQQPAPRDEHAFGWPKGSVRAILALEVVSIALVAAIVIVVRLPMDNPLVLSASGFLWGAGNLALGYYLGKQDA